MRRRRYNYHVDKLIVCYVVFFHVWEQSTHQIETNIIIYIDSGRTKYIRHLVRSSKNSPLVFNFLDKRWYLNFKWSSYRKICLFFSFLSELYFTVLCWYHHFAYLYNVSFSLITMKNMKFMLWEIIESGIYIIIKK